MTPKPGINKKLREKVALHVVAPALFLGIANLISGCNYFGGSFNASDKYRVERNICVDNFFSTAPTLKIVLFYLATALSTVFFILLVRFYIKYRKSPEGQSEIANPQQPTRMINRKMMWGIAIGAVLFALLVTAIYNYF